MRVLGRVSAEQRIRVRWKAMGDLKPRRNHKILASRFHKRIRSTNRHQEVLDWECGFGSHLDIDIVLVFLLVKDFGYVIDCRALHHSHKIRVCGGFDNVVANHAHTSVRNLIREEIYVVIRVSCKRSISTIYKAGCLFVDANLIQ